MCSCVRIFCEYLSFLFIKKENSFVKIPQKMSVSIGHVIICSEEMGGARKTHPFRGLDYYSLLVAR